MGTEDISIGVKQPGDQSPASSAEVKNVRRYTSTPHTSTRCGV